MQDPGKSWNLLGSDADSGHNDVDADVKICASAHLYSVNNCKKCSNSFVAISSQHVSVMKIYCSMDAAIILYTPLYMYVVSNCCLSLYLNIAGLHHKVR